MKIAKACLITTSISLVLSACTHVQEVANPTDITLKAAILEVADSIYEAQQHTQGRPKAGLIVDEATVQFNVSAKATAKTTIGGEAAGIPLNPAGTLKLSVSNEVYSEGNRGNTVTVKFKNLATAAVNKNGLEFLKNCAANPRAAGCDGFIIMSPPLATR